MQLDKAMFSRSVQVVALRVPVSSCTKLLKSFKGHLIAIPKLKKIVPDGKSADFRLMLLDEKFKDANSLPAEQQSLLKEYKVESAPYEVKLDFNHLSTDEILRQVLPPEMTIPSGFETAGHIARLNLSDDQMPYRKLIGEVILEKNRQIKTVVVKKDNIENQFRTYPLEIVAGEAKLETVLKEYGCLFLVDFEKVYWNSRLSTEHRRLVASFKFTDQICDMFCGVGPFAIPAAKKGCTVYANDLNPDSVKYLKHNIKQNKVSGKVSVFNLDARDFMQKMAQQQLKGLLPPFDHILMNLPASAHTFLDVFLGLYASQPNYKCSSTVHCYCFIKGSEDPQKLAIELVTGVLGQELEHVTARVVRDVAPSKLMMCVSFKLPRSVTHAAEIKAAVASSSASLDSSLSTSLTPSCCSSLLSVSSCSPSTSSSDCALPSGPVHPVPSAGSKRAGSAAAALQASDDALFLTEPATKRSKRALKDV
eukprot:gb/GEZN01005161.1/.p1 GENE.gb/GEZN01005161.1/~~gb/GEZN01005161.1/.p1  ORF type:complete len:478 (-),score=108.10 gb/GEZN01005161.1/:379-1812(-)